MRSIERIEKFINTIDIGNLIYHIWKINDQISIDRLNFLYNKKEVLTFWKDNPDLRFSQVLINLGLIPNVPGFWYYMEDDVILEKQLNKYE